MEWTGVYNQRQGCWPCRERGTGIGFQIVGIKASPVHWMDGCLGFLEALGMKKVLGFW